MRDASRHLAIEDHGLLGDGMTAALVGANGTIDWMCVPRFDAPPLFCSILDAKRGGAFRLALEGVRRSRQEYLPDTGVLVTALESSTARVEVTDALALRAGAHLEEGTEAARAELVRSVRAAHGDATLAIEIAPRGGARFERRGTSSRIRCAARPELELWAWSSAGPLGEGEHRVRLRPGERLDLVLRWGAPLGGAQPPEPGEALAATAEAWRRWAGLIHYEGAHRELVRRSALTLKMLDHFANGAMMAAPTSSLPERVGGPRNWDYRYTWVRDAAFSVYALRRIGLPRESERFLSWVLGVIGTGETPRVLYDLDGRPPPPEREDPELEGYQGSHPVRWGNAAASQTQHDALGELVDCAFQWFRSGGVVEEELWGRLTALIEEAARRWNEPDHGIWEVRTPGRPFTYSAAMCQVALDRGARMAQAVGEPAAAARWGRGAEVVRAAILDQAWDPRSGTLREHLGGGHLDASVLALPLRRVVTADDPRMRATTDAVASRLAAGGGLLYRYDPARSPDGLPGHEGAMLLCSFWLVEVLALQGRLGEAWDLFERLCGKANALGLLPEQLDPGTGAFLGNFPQAFSHVGLVSSAVRLARSRG